MKRIIIPRKDHEVYFIKTPDDLRAKQIKPFILEQLEKLHPVFSSDFSVDFKLFVFDKTRWAMVTIIKGEILTEYRILNKSAVFYTNTSITAHKKEFTKNGVNSFRDELIGFDAEKGLPVSIPLEANGIGDSQIKSVNLKSIPARHGVFAGKKHKWHLAAVIAGIVGIFLLSSSFILTKEDTIKHLPVETNIEEKREVKYIPEAIEILAKFSSDFVNAGGQMERWQYDEDAASLIVIQAKGINALTVHQIFDEYEYVYLLDVQDVRYNSGEPFFAINLNTIPDKYSIPEREAFLSQNNILPVVSRLTKDLQDQKLSIVSETLPSTSNGNNIYSVTYTAEDRNLIFSLEMIDKVCQEYSLRVKSLDISIGSDNHLFTVICSLAGCKTVNCNFAMPRIEKEAIPKAFGYKKILPIVVLPVKSPEKKPEHAMIGSIRDSDGKLLFYRDSGDGKIKVRGN
ncbi:MAG: hypothetical protein LBH43_16870 [Treponema sp.]|jgi:uncharacterized protein (DUF1330 family)|nr:hypothetical protein [Treponema sp.]